METPEKDIKDVVTQLAKRVAALEADVAKFSGLVTDFGKSIEDEIDDLRTVVSQDFLTAYGQWKRGETEQ